jgi:hypothetical protein
MKIVLLIIVTVAIVMIGQPLYDFVTGLILSSTGFHSVDDGLITIVTSFVALLTAIAWIIWFHKRQTSRLKIYESSALGILVSELREGFLDEALWSKAIKDADQEGLDPEAIYGESRLREIGKDNDRIDRRIADPVIRARRKAHRGMRQKEDRDRVF